MGAVIVVSSHVARGSVGNRAMVFALERFGFEVWAVPTVIMAHHPGHGLAERIVPADGQFAALLDDLLRNGRIAGVAGIVSGYLASPAQAEAVARLVRAVKAAHPAAVYLCDPVIGDAGPSAPGRLYVDPLLAAAIRDHLLPIADAATPNAFECGWLSGDNASGADLAERARRLGPPAVLVTSAPALTPGHIGNLLVEPSATTLLEHPVLATPVKGTGDLLASILLARRLRGQDWTTAAEQALASVVEILAGTAEAGADETMLAAFQGAIVQPRGPVHMRRIPKTRSRPVPSRRSGRGA